MQWRTDHPPLQAQADGFRRQCLDMTGHRVVAFVTVQVDWQAALSGDFAQAANRGGAVLHGAFEMGDAADNIYAHVERAQEVLLGIRAAEQAVLREGHQLQVYVWGDLPAHLDQGLGRGQAVIADIDMGSDRQKPLRYGKVAVAKGALHHRFDGQQRLQFTPKGDPLQKRAGAVQARQAKAEGGVHVEMGVDERGGDQPSCRIDHALRRGGKRWPDVGDYPVQDANIDRQPRVRQPTALDHKIEHGPPSILPGQRP